MTTPLTHAPPTHSERAVADWLAGALADPAHARQEWADYRLAVLPLGTQFTAVRIRADVIEAAVGSPSPTLTAGMLETALNGPVIHDPNSHRYYALTALDTTGWRPADGAVLVGRGTWLGVPRVQDVEPRQASYWAVPPQRPRDVCDPAAVAELVAVGRARLPAEEG